MPLGIVAALYFGGNDTKARWTLKEQGYIPGPPGKSRVSRRLHRVKHHFLTLFNVFGELGKGAFHNLFIDS